jgi:hypothetical protein
MPAGSPWPLGIHWVEADDSFSFALYSKHATGVTLVCYPEADLAEPIFEFRLAQPAHKTEHVWYGRIPASELRGAAVSRTASKGRTKPHQSYEHGEAFEESRRMVQPFHAAGIEVWLGSMRSLSSSCVARPLPPFDSNRQRSAVDIDCLFGRRTRPIPASCEIVLTTDSWFRHVSPKRGRSFLAVSLQRDLITTRALSFNPTP